MSREKAIAMAVGHHSVRHCEPVEVVIDVAVQDLGVADSETNDDGKVVFKWHDEDLIQMIEW
jgi:hypothetical protein